MATATVLLMMSSQVEAAAVAGQDDWEDLTAQEELSADKPLEVHGKIKLERKIFRGPKDYPTTFGETKNTAEAQIDWRLRFAPSWYVKGRLQGDRIWHGRGGRDNKLSFKQLYAEGKIGVVTFRAGKIPIFDALNLSNGGLVIDSEITGGQGFFESGTEKNNSVFTAGFDYKFNRHWTLGAIYSAGNFSAWLAYRQAGRIGSYRPAYKGVGFGERGTEIGVRYQALKDLAFEVIYFDGNKVSRLSPPAPDKDNPKIHKWYLGAEYSF